MNSTPDVLRQHVLSSAGYTHPSELSKTTFKESGTESRSRTRTATATESFADSANIVALIENRSREVGVAAYNRASFEVQLRQYGDTNLFSTTLALLNVLEPTAIVLCQTSADGSLDTALRQTLTRNAKATYLPRRLFNETIGLLDLQELAVQECLGVTSTGIPKYLALSSFAALVKHLEATIGMKIMRRCLRVTFKSDKSTVFLDSMTIDGLELIRNAQGGRQGTLFTTLNRCKTAAGARFLRQSLLEPPCDLATIRMRQDVVQTLLSDDDAYFKLCSILADLPDLEKNLAHLIQNQYTSPESYLDRGSRIQLLRCILDIKRALTALPLLLNALTNLQCGVLLALVDTLRSHDLVQLREVFNETVEEDATSSSNPERMRLHGAFTVKAGVNGLLDVARKTLTETIEDMHTLAVQLRDEHNLSNLRLHYSVQRGYHLRCGLSAGQTSDPEGALYVVKQKNSVFFTTQALLDLNDRYNESLQEIWLMSHRELAHLLEKIYVTDTIIALHRLCDCVAFLDYIVALATNVTLSEGYTKPRVMSDGPIAIKQGLHPILSARSDNCVANDTFLSTGNNVHVISGVNMAGKTTYLRQIGLLTIMAHMGSFVPARFASIRLISRICSRMVMGDASEHNQSSFAREMSELASIQSCCADTVHGVSLLLIDELGRSTNFVEGSTLTWAVAERMAANPRVLALFATHFSWLRHLEELTATYAEVRSHLASVEVVQNRLSRALVSSISSVQCQVFSPGGQAR